MPGKDMDQLQPLAGRWHTMKPKDFSGKELEEALKQAQGVEIGRLAMPTPLKAPDRKISEIKTSITQLDKDSALLKEALNSLTGLQTKLTGITKAADNTQSELDKMAKAKKASGDEKKKFETALKLVTEIRTKAGDLLKTIQ